MLLCILVFVQFRYQPRPRPKYPPQFPDRRRPSSSNPYSPIKRPNSNANGVRVKLINKVINT